MKKIFTTLSFILTFSLFGQGVPEGISYQAVAIDPNGLPVPGIDPVGVPIDGAEINVRISILEGSPTGGLLYEEEHLVLTDQYGMFTLTIGQGIQTGGTLTFPNIIWESDKKYLQTELDLKKNGNYTLTSVQQLMSVPFAFVAKDVLNNDDDDADPTNEIQTISINGSTVSLSNNGGSITLPPDQVNDADADPTNEIQTIALNNGVVTLSNNGGSITLPPDADADSTNELQTLSINGTTVSLSNNGGSITLPPDQVNDADADPTNEIQTLSKSGNTISLTNGGNVTVFDGNYNNLSNTPTIPTKTSDLTNDSGFIITEVDGSTTNELQVLSLSNDTIYLTSGGYVVLPAGFDGDYNSLTNKPAIPTKTSELLNDSGFLTSEKDSSTFNELQTLTISNDTIFLSEGGYVKLPLTNSTNSNVPSQTAIFSLNTDTLIEVPQGQSWLITSIQIHPTNPPCETWVANFVRYESSGVVYSGSPGSYNVCKLGSVLLSKSWDEKWSYGQSNSGPGSTRTRTECFDNSIFSSLNLPFILNPGDSLNLYYPGIIVNVEVHANSTSSTSFTSKNWTKSQNDSVFIVPYNISALKLVVNGVMGGKGGTAYYVSNGGIGGPANCSYPGGNGGDAIAVELLLLNVNANDTIKLSKSFAGANSSITATATYCGTGCISTAQAGQGDDGDPTYLYVNSELVKNIFL